MRSRHRFAGKRPKIKGQFTARFIDMLKSPAYRTLSLSGHRALSRLEIELAKHAGNDNGNLVVTFDDFEAYGIHRHAVAPAIRELCALGFAEITEHGCAGNAYERTATRYRLTMIAVGTMEPTNEWKKIGSLEEAERVAAAARAAKNKIQWRKSPPGPVAKTTTEKPKCPVAESAPPTDFSNVENRHYSLDLPRREPAVGDAPATPPAPPASPGVSARGGLSAPSCPAAPTAGQRPAASKRANRERCSEASGVPMPPPRGKASPADAPNGSGVAGRVNKPVSEMNKSELDAAHAARRARYDGAHANGPAAERE
jgi:hypothetical protein